MPTKKNVVLQDIAKRYSDIAKRPRNKDDSDDDRTPPRPALRGGQATSSSSSGRGLGRTRSRRSKKRARKVAPGVDESVDSPRPAKQKKDARDALIEYMEKQLTDAWKWCNFEKKHMDAFKERYSNVESLRTLVGLGGADGIAMTEVDKDLKKKQCKKFTKVSSDIVAELRRLLAPGAVYERKNNLKNASSHLSAKKRNVLAHMAFGNMNPSRLIPGSKEAEDAAWAAFSALLDDPDPAVSPPVPSSSPPAPLRMLESPPRPSGVPQAAPAESLPRDAVEDLTTRPKRGGDEQDDGPQLDENKRPRDGDGQHDPDEPPPKKLRQFLQSKNLQQYVHVLEACGVESVDDLRLIKEEDLEKRGLKPVQRRKLLEHISHLGVAEFKEQIRRAQLSTLEQNGTAFYGREGTVAAVKPQWHNREKTRVILLTGSRGTGKSTTLRLLSQQDAELRATYDHCRLVTANASVVKTELAAPFSAAHFWQVVFGGHLTRVFSGWCINERDFRLSSTTTLLREFDLPVAGDHGLVALVQQTTAAAFGASDAPIVVQLDEGGEIAEHLDDLLHVVQGPNLLVLIAGLSDGRLDKVKKQTSKYEVVGRLTLPCMSAASQHRILKDLGGKDYHVALYEPFLLATLGIPRLVKLAVNAVMQLDAASSFSSAFDIWMSEVKVYFGDALSHAIEQMGAAGLAAALVAMGSAVGVKDLDDPLLPGVTSTWADAVRCSVAFPVDQSYSIPLVVWRTAAGDQLEGRWAEVLAEVAALVPGLTEDLLFRIYVDPRKWLNEAAGHAGGDKDTKVGEWWEEAFAASLACSYRCKVQCGSVSATDVYSAPASSHLRAVLSTLQLDLSGGITRAQTRLGALDCPTNTVVLSNCRQKKAHHDVLLPPVAAVACKFSLPVDPMALHREKQHQVGKEDDAAEVPCLLQLCMTSDDRAPSKTGGVFATRTLEGKYAFLGGRGCISGATMRWFTYLHASRTKQTAEMPMWGVPDEYLAALNATPRRQVGKAFTVVLADGTRLASQNEKLALGREHLPTHDKRVSRAHAELQWDNGGVALRALGTNPIEVDNGGALSKGDPPHVLYEGDTFYLVRGGLHATLQTTQPRC